ncbi:uncharacterized protein LOC142890608 [Nelusetta ayraudi]|uniref:uncharacterized protein LOC142890608 n=1 Tax=Nelusetta ayraudi TaxID=303726 RepID=UPI003F72564F
MISILAVFMVLTSSAQAKGSIECNFVITPPQTECSGASGQLLLFHLPKSGIMLKKDESDRILEIPINGTGTLYMKYTNETKFLSNGTLMLGRAKTSHSGKYTLERHGNNGTIQREVMHVQIQAAVSRVDLSQWCESAENRIVTCSAEGNPLNFNLTLDGELLQLKQGRPGSRSIMLPIKRTGMLVCTVWNHFSQQQDLLWVTKSCGWYPEEPEPFVFSPHFVTATVVAMTVGGVLVLLAAVYLEKRNFKPGAAADDNDESIYSVVLFQPVTSKDMRGGIRIQRLVTKPVKKD